MRNHENLKGFHVVTLFVIYVSLKLERHLIAVRSVKPNLVMVVTTRRLFVVCVCGMSTPPLPAPVLANPMHLIPHLHLSPLQSSTILLGLQQLELLKEFHVNSVKILRPYTAVRTAAN